MDANATLWAERYDRELSDIFALQDELTLAIVRAVAPRSFEAESRRASRLQTRDLGVWDTVARARYLYYQYSKDAWDEVVPFLRQAIARHPDTASLQVLLSNVLVVQIPFGWYGTRADTLKDADDAAREALRLDPQDASAHLSRAVVRLFQGRHDEAASSAERAVELNPNSADVMGSMARVFGLLGEYRRSMAFLGSALELSPNDMARPSWHAGTAIGAFIVGRYDDAVRLCSDSIEISPSFPTPHRQRAAALALLGRLDEARQDVATLLRLAPNATITETRALVPLAPPYMETFLDGLRKAGLPE